VRVVVREVLEIPEEQRVHDGRADLRQIQRYEERKKVRTKKIDSEVEFL
jgi:hypothetical protein